MLGFFYYATLRLGCVYTSTEAVEFFSNCGLFGQGVRKRVKGIGRFASKKTSKEHEWTNQAGKFWLQMQLLWTGEQKWQVQEPMGAYRNLNFWLHKLKRSIVFNLQFLWQLILHSCWSVDKQKYKTYIILVDLWTDNYILPGWRPEHALKHAGASQHTIST